MKAEPPELREGWLAFESQTERRRVISPGADWEQMSEAELVELLGRSVSTGRVRRLIE